MGGDGNGLLGVTSKIPRGNSICPSGWCLSGECNYCLLYFLSTWCYVTLLQDKMSQGFPHILVETVKHPQILHKAMSGHGPPHPPFIVFLTLCTWLVFLMSCTWLNCPDLLLPLSHTVSDQKLEVGMAWEW